MLKETKSTLKGIESVLSAVESVLSVLKTTVDGTKRMRKAAPKIVRITMPIVNECLGMHFVSATMLSLAMTMLSPTMHSCLQLERMVVVLSTV